MSDKSKDEFWTAVSYVERSKNRAKTLKILAESEKPLTPTEISEKLDIVLNSASRALSQLKEENIVACINPDAKIYRRYRPTKLGEKIAEKF
jgi:DNA-binding transcriptional ArsR family regulator